MDVINDAEKNPSGYSEEDVLYYIRGRTFSR